jgi:hypothetical protein
VPPDSPPTLASLIGWLKADSFIPALPDGTVVGTSGNDLVDQSDEGRDATFSVGTPPTYETNEVNGLPVIRFSTVQAQLNFPELVFAGDFTVAFVGRTTAGLDTLWLGHDTLNHQLRMNRAGVYIASYYAGLGELLSSAFGGASSDFQCIIWRRSGTTVSFRQNKVSRGTASEAVQTARFNTLCNNIFVGTGRGDLGEIAFWEAAHSDAAVDGMYDNWWQPRWALP